MRISGDGFIQVADGSHRWGRFGAAGVLVRHVDGDGVPHFFLARRSLHCHNGGTWAIPGGALDHGEEPLEGALREFSEEIGVHLGEHTVVQSHEDDHGGWSYWTIVVDIAERFPEPTQFNWETAEVAWVPAAELSRLELFGAFQATLAKLGFLEP
jgi:8-oxo-dGTP diphosphatase